MEHVDDLAFVQQCVRQGSMLWTYQVNVKIRQRGMKRQMVVESVDTDEVIATYTQS